MKIEEVKDIDVGFPAIFYPDILSFQGNLDIYHKSNKVSYKIDVEFSFSSSELMREFVYCWKFSKGYKNTLIEHLRFNENQMIEIESFAYEIVNSDIPELNGKIFTKNLYQNI